MNKDSAKLYLPLVQALAEGKTIQFYFSWGQWEDASKGEVTFAHPPQRYRVKPELVCTPEYRRYIGMDGLVRLLHRYERLTPGEQEHQPYFSRWIDTEWQKHEVPLL